MPSQEDYLDNLLKGIGNTEEEENSRKESEEGVKDETLQDPQIDMSDMDDLLQSALEAQQRDIPKLSGELYLCILTLTFPVTAYVAYGITGNVFLSLFLGVAAVTAEILSVVILSGKTYDRIEEDTPLFVSILNNHAKSSTDIVTIMTRTVSGMDGPIKEIVSGFLVTAEKYGNADLAFDFACESVDNRTLKTIFVNLKNCMHYQANYEEVLTQMMGQITESMSAREERKNILFSMKLTLIAISVMSVIIVALIGKGIGVDVKGILTKNLAGQCILFITGIMYLFVIVKVFRADR